MLERGNVMSEGNVSLEYGDMRHLHHHFKVSNLAESNAHLGPV